MENNLIQMIPLWVWLIVIWDSVWKMIAFWKSARNNHMAWFIIMAITNTAGILPIIYILTHRKCRVTVKSSDMQQDSL